MHAQYIVPTRSETTYQYAIAKRLVTPFTHPRGVRLALLEQVSRASKVSIHAPERGATQCPATGKRTGGVSIHAPTRGATRDFQKALKSAEVSIHAPTRGATRDHPGRVVTLQVSIHAPARGATAGMGRWLWSCLYRPALAKVLKLSLLSGAAST